MMITRTQLQTVLTNLAQFPAVALLGPRQVGKTTLALELAAGRESVYLDLENPSDYHKLADAERYLTRHEDKLVILDEVHRVPGLFASLRGLIDQGRRRGLKAGRFLLLGSASMDLLRQSGESLAGRVAYVELTPLGVAELKQPPAASQPQTAMAGATSVASQPQTAMAGATSATSHPQLGPAAAADPIPLDQLWLRGGFPDSLLAASDQHSMAWRRNFVRTYLERDVPSLGPRIPAETLRRFWTMLAHSQGSPFNGAQLAGSLALSGQTVARYLDLMVDLLLVRRLQPCLANVRKRLVKAPKVYVRDSGIVHALLNIPNHEALLGHPVCGASWEGLVIDNLLAAAPDGSLPSYYRTATGTEVDLVLDLPGLAQRWVVEIKRGSVAKPGKGLPNAIADLQADQSFVVYGGTERYPLAANITALSLPELVELLRQTDGHGEPQTVPKPTPNTI